MKLHRVILGVGCLLLLVGLVLSAGSGATRPVVILYSNDTIGYLDPCG
jgi:hypothetical protein